MCSLIWSICDDNLLLLRTKNNFDTCHSKIIDLFNIKSKIIYLWQQTLSFDESYSDLEDTFSLFFNDINGA